MNILIVTSTYPPEIRSSSHLMEELAAGLVKRGYSVTVLTTYPDNELIKDRKQGTLNEFSTEEQIQVIRVKTPSPHRGSFFIRGLSQILLPIILIKYLQKYLQAKPDIVIVYSPPLTLAIVGQAVKKKYKAKFILNVQDIFPQNGIDLGIINNPVVIKFFEFIEKRAYLQSDNITAHSQSNAEFLIKYKKVPINKIHILYNWIDIAPYIGIKRSGIFRERYALKERFIFLFAGIMGVSQSLDLILDIAADLQSFEDICFLLVGDGSERKRLEKKTKDKGLTNVIFKPFVSKDEYPILVKDSDVGIICLSPKNKTPVVPGKLLGYMAAGIPVCGFLNENSDAHNIVVDARCGYTAVSDNYASMLHIVRKLYEEKDKLHDYGKRGFLYVKEHFDKEMCIDKLEKIFNYSLENG